MAILPEMEFIKISQTKTERNAGQFVIEPLMPGYGITVGNSLRRILLSSLTGAAIHAVRVAGINHEFGPIPGAKEDMIELTLNLKSLRLQLQGVEPTTISLKVKGPSEVRAKNFATNPLVEIVNPNHYLATLDRKGALELEAMVNRGYGYVPTERKREEKLPAGWIVVDSIYSPITKVNYIIENTRVGQITNFDKVTLDITTDGTIDPAGALEQAAEILAYHFSFIRKIGEQAKGAAPRGTKPQRAGKPTKKAKTK